jgi:hypothetical protein
VPTPQTSLQKKGASIPLTRTVTLFLCLWVLVLASSCEIRVTEPEQDHTDALEDQRLAVSDSVPLSSPQPWSEAAVMVDVSSRKVAYGGRNIGSRRVWRVRHEIVFSGAANSWSHPLGDVQTTSSKATLLGLSQARFELRPAPNGSCVAWREEGVNSWGYAWVRQDTIACPHILGAAPEADPCQNAHTVDTLARAILGIEAFTDHHPFPAKHEEWAATIRYVSTHLDDKVLLQAVVHNAVLRSAPLGGSGLQLAFLDEATMTLLQGAVHSDPALWRYLLENLSLPKKAWTRSASHSLMLLERAANLETQNAVAALLGGIHTVPWEAVDGNYSRYVTRTLAHITELRGTSSPEILSQMEHALLHEKTGPHERAWLLRGVVAAGQTSSKKTLDALAAQSEAQPLTAWPKTFEAVAEQVRTTPNDELGTQVIGWAKHLAEIY